MLNRIMYAPSATEYREVTSRLKSSLSKYGEALKSSPKVGGMSKRFTTGLKVMIEDGVWFKRTLDKMDKLNIPASSVSKYVDFDDFLNDLKMLDAEWEKGRKEEESEVEDPFRYMTNFRYMANGKYPECWKN